MLLFEQWPSRKHIFSVYFHSFRYVPHYNFCQALGADSHEDPSAIIEFGEYYRIQLPDPPI
jgi:hypothetical protein